MICCPNCFRSNCVCGDEQPNPRANMSESSETKAPQLNHDLHETQAVYQPSPPAVGLSEKERKALDRADHIMWQHSNESRHLGYHEKANETDDHRQAIKNLLTRDAQAKAAKPDGVVVREERRLAVNLLGVAKTMRGWVCEDAAYGSMVSEFTTHEDLDDDVQVCHDVVAANVIIAEAEAALAEAKGGA